MPLLAVAQVQYELRLQAGSAQSVRPVTTQLFEAGLDCAFDQLERQPTRVTSNCVCSIDVIVWAGRRGDTVVVVIDSIVAFHLMAHAVYLLLRAFGDIPLVLCPKKNEVACWDWARK